jgi:hypothetical protein
MSRRQKYLNVLSEILPAGFVGASMLLAGVSSSANEHPALLQPRSSDSVSERLAAIRDAVSTLTGEADSAANGANADQRLAWGNWWRNWGWYRPWRGWGWPNWRNWPNWHNWRNWWHNW